MHPNHTTRTGVHPRCPTCQKMLRTNGTCGNCEKPEVAEYYRLHAQGLRCCNICKETLPLTDFALIRKGQERRRTVCRSCSDAKNKAYRDTNAARLKAKQDARKQDRHEWYEQWREANPHAVRVRKAITSAITRGLPANFTAEDWERSIEHWQGRCAYCDQPEGLLPENRLSAEHFVPLSSPHCPGSTPDNILPVCLSCNMRRKAQNVREWLEATFDHRHAKRMLAKIEAYFAQLSS